MTRLGGGGGGGGGGCACLQTSPVDLQGLIAAGLARMHTLDMPGSRTAMLWEVGVALGA